MFQNTSYQDIKSNEEIIKIIYSEEFKEIFIKNRISNIIIFGSLANGQFNEDSDVDIAIIGNESVAFDTELRITCELEELLGRSIDLIDIKDENVNNIIKIEALNSKFIVIKDELLDISIEYYDKLYKENQEFWHCLDREVLSQ